MLAAKAGTSGCCKVQMIWLSAGRRFFVIPSLTMRTSQRIGAPASSAARAAMAMPGEKRMWGARSTIPAAWIIRTATISSSGVKRARSASARIMAKLCT